MTAATLLIVDDEPSNFDVIEAVLATDDYLLHYAASGEKAIAALETLEPDLILLDVMMPGLDGLETCQHIKGLSQWKLLPIIMVTALDGEDNLARCLEAGADDFISKPVKPLELRARIRSLLRIKYQQDRIEQFAILQRDTISFLGQSLSDLRGGLASMFPHELNTPLNGVLNALRLLKMEPDFNPQGSAHLEELMAIAEQSALRMNDLVKRFLRYLYLTLGENKLSQEQRDLQLDLLEMDADEASTDLISDLATVKATLHRREGDLICQIPSLTLPVKAFYVYWVVSELLENAFKFSLPGTPVEVEGTVSNGEFHLTIQDEGRGMTPTQIKNIDAFVQFERHRYEQQGMGLGLKIVQLATEKVQGRFFVTSTYGEQTQVHWVIPLF